MSDRLPIALGARSSDGFIVVAVLWILGALATLATVYSVYVINTATALAVNDDRLKSEGLISAGVELAAHQLTSVPEIPPVGRFSFRLGDATVGVEFRSESARVDLNTASKELLSGLFTSIGLRREMADDLADRIVAWRTAPPEGQDQEASNYRTAGLKYAPRGAPFPHIDELSLVLGVTPDLMERIAPFVTVYSGQPGVNVLAALPQVVAALPGMTPDRLYAILAQRQAPIPDVPAITALLGPAQAYATTDSSRSVRINVRVQFDSGNQMSSDLVILLIDDGTEPYRILSWRDELDGPPADRFRIGGGRGTVAR
jgi:general secretion pathway protein K